MNWLTRKEDAPATHARAQNPIELLQMAVENNVDVTALEKLMDLQDRYVADLAKRSFNSALAQFQSATPPIPCSKTVKDKSGNARYKYAPLDKVQEYIKPHLAANGLSVRFSTKLHSDGYLTALCFVTHADGHTEESEFTCPADKEMRVNDSQRQGSVNSYAKRYALANALNLVFEKEDDDGNRGGTKTVSADQAIQIRDLVTAKKVDEAAFFRWCGATTYEDIPAGMYDRIRREYS